MKRLGSNLLTLPASIRSGIASSLLVIKTSLRSFGANRNLENAATLAFYGFLSLMPLLLLSLLVTAAVLRSSEQAGELITSLLRDLFPALQIDVVRDLNAIAGGRTLGLISFLLLIWAMTPLSGALRTALARMFNMPIQRPFLKSKLLDLAAVLVFLLLFLLLLGFRAFDPETSGAHLRPFAQTLLSAIHLLASLAVLGLFFRVFAPVRLTVRQWLLGAVCVILLWSLMRNLFVAFIQYNPDYGFAFGSLKAIFLLIVWVYYSFATLLFGAEIMANTFRRDALVLRRLLQPATPDAPPTASTSLMSKFERRLPAGQILFREGDPGSEMFVVLDGQIRLTHAGHELAVLDRGRYFGEMSLLTHAPRSATATAIDDTRLAAVTQRNFDLLIRENPLLVRSMLQELARRLNETNRKLQT